MKSATARTLQHDLPENSVSIAHLLVYMSVLTSSVYLRTKLIMSKKVLQLYAGSAI